MGLGSIRLIAKLAPLLLALLFTNCKNQQKFNSERVASKKNQPTVGTEKRLDATTGSEAEGNGFDDSSSKTIKKNDEQDTETDDSVIQNNEPDIDKLPTPPPGTSPPFDPSELNPNDHNVESNCDICLQKADYLAQSLGFRVNINLSMNYGPSPAAQAGYPGLCDIHFQSPNRSSEFYFFCPCNCGWPNRSY